MRIFNSLSNKIEDFIPINAGEVSMYVCGPTVYNHPHIGNARPLIVFDLVYRTFLALGYDVKYVSNYTDIDDRIIEQALLKKVSASDISEKYIKAYEDLAVALNIKPRTTIRVTDTIAEIVDFIERLVENDFAYVIDNDVYFRIDKAGEYGKLSNQKIADLMVGARIEANLNKANPLDFTLWKRTSQGETYPSPWGEGRPGWHTECVVMINESFNNKKIDIHGGGMDLKFPHHENEIAQANVCGNHDLANYWMHNGLITIDGQKMSKSKGELILAKDMVAELGYDVVRWLMLSTHYRAPLKLSDDYIKQSQNELLRVYTALNQGYARVILNRFNWDNTYDSSLYNKFLTALKDDFNTANAYKEIFDTIKLLNASLRVADVDYNRVIELVNSVVKMLDVLGIVYEFVDISIADIEIYDKWKMASSDKAYGKADIYRQQLIEKGLM